MKRIILVGLAVVLLAVAVLAASVLWSTLSAKLRAEQLARDVRSLEGSTATLEDVKRLARKYPVGEVYYAPGCSDEACQISITIKNTWLQRLRLAPETSFETLLDVERARLRYFQLGFVKSRPPFLPLHVRALEVIPREGDTYERDFIESCVGDGSLKLATAYILPSASFEEQEKAFTFNFDCLTKIGGCEDHEFMPRLCVRPQR